MKRSFSRNPVNEKLAGFCIKSFVVVRRQPLCVNAISTICGFLADDFVGDFEVTLDPWADYGVAVLLR